MIEINNLSFSYPQKDLYSEISFTLEEGQHCAFIGTNGSGKSTLIDMILDPENYMFDGKINIDPNCRIGYVSQFATLDNDTDLTVFEYLAQDFTLLQDEITALCTEMETATDLETLFETYQQALDAFDAIGGDDYETRILKNLELAGLAKHKDLAVSQLSGGEFKLVQVMKEMLTQPGLLIMDEPDVFLDFDHLNALRTLINSHKGILLVITHNRYLLNHCFNKILHLENKELQEFDGSYIDYNFNLLQTKIELQELAVADNEEIERNEQLIKRLRASATHHADVSKGKSLKARVKIQERLMARRVKMPFVEIQSPAIQFPKLEIPEENVADKILEVVDYTVSFDDLLLNQVNFELQQGEKVAIIGANGTGKTTLLRHIFENNHKTIEIASDTEVGYLSQSQGEVLNEADTVLNAFYEIGFDSTEGIINYVKDYGFDEEMVHQKVEKLSGGEKNVLQLALIGASKANFLLLDEPTSHLDTYAQICLEKALENYKGTVLMISHDYYTIANTVDYLLYIDDKTIRKVSNRKFRKMIYANHFNKDYLELERNKKALETKIESALQATNFELAKTLSEDLEKIVQQCSTFQ